MVCGSREIAQFRARGKRGSRLRANRRARLRLVSKMRRGTARGGEAGDFAFDQCFVEAADSGDLAGAINATDGGLLRGVDAHIAILDGAAEEPRQFEIGHEMKAAAEVIAGNLSHCAAALDGHRIECNSLRAHWLTHELVRYVRGQSPHAVAGAFQQFCGMGDESGRKAKKAL